MTKMSKGGIIATEVLILADVIIFGWQVTLGILVLVAWFIFCYLTAGAAMKKLRQWIKK